MKPMPRTKYIYYGFIGYLYVGGSSSSFNFQEEQILELSFSFFLFFVKLYYNDTTVDRE